MNSACTGKVIAHTLMLTLTGIQYADYKNCDLIVVPNPTKKFSHITGCDFHNSFETDSPGAWKVESRTTCVGWGGGTLTLPSPLTSHPHLPRPLAHRHR